MANEIRIPRLGWSMEEGTFVGWLKRDGETIKAGDPLFELEGEKALQEVESLDAGTLHICPNGPAAGSVVPVGTLLGYVLMAGEPVPSPTDSTNAAATAAAIPASASHSTTQPTTQPTTQTTSLQKDVRCESLAPAPRLSVEPIPQSVPSGNIAATPSVRRLARELGVDLQMVNGTGMGGRIDAQDVRRESECRRDAASTCQLDARVAVSKTKRVSTPRARRVARELGVDWTQVSGTGRDGRVRERDIRSFAASPKVGRGAGQTLASLKGGLVPLTQRRRVIAERMQASQQQTAAVTLTAQADVTELVKLRRQLQSDRAAAGTPSYSDIIAHVAARTLLQHRQLAGRWTERGIELPADDELHIGIAVDTEAGLVVPVVRDVARRSLADLAADAKQLIESARSGRLSAADMQGGVFTVTNLGSFGIDAFTPIINWPQVAILGLGSIRREAVVLDDNSIAAHDVMTLSLTFDHRVLDGAPAARFLQDLIRAIASLNDDASANAAR